MEKKIYCVKFNFIFDEENPVPCEFFVESDSFVDAVFKATDSMVCYVQLCSVSVHDS